MTDIDAALEAREARWVQLVDISIAALRLLAINGALDLESDDHKEMLSTLVEGLEGWSDNKALKKTRQQ